MFDTLQWAQHEFPGLFVGLVFVVGACIGSFLNVVIYRLPAGLSIVHPGSRCACGTPIAWYNNVPILSWVLLGGRARCCGRRFSIRYPLVELLTAALFVAAWLVYAPAVAGVLMVFFAMMIAQGFIDLDTMEIPDVFSIGGFVLGVLLSMLVPALHGYSGDHWLLDGMRAFIASLQGAFIGSALLLWIALLAEVFLRRETMGDGDIKLLGAIGAFCGWQGAVFSIFGGALVGTLMYLVFSMTGGLSPAKAAPPSPAAEATPAPPSHHMPFGPALAIGAILYLLVFHPSVDAFFLDFGRVLFQE